jgi:hydroxymethylbilane synthase
MNFKIGTRGSQLALWQAHYIQNKLSEIGHEVTIEIIKTQGDAIQHLGFDKMEGKGFFTKELEEALLNKTIDIAVHSHKDLPTTLPPQLCIAAVSYRETASDTILINKDFFDSKELLFVSKNAVIGTSSIRRKTQIKALRPDTSIADLRGNVNTRIQKLKDKKYNAIILATAGIKRLNLNLEDFVVKEIDTEILVPAPAQGVLAVEILKENSILMEEIKKLNNTLVQETIRVERSVLQLFEGGCQLPLGVYSEKIKNTWTHTVAYSRSIEKAPLRHYVESSNNTGVAKHIVAQLNSVKPCRLLLTATKNNFQLLESSLTSNAFDVKKHSFIKTQTVFVNTIPQADWIFFNSKNAVKHFFENCKRVTASLDNYKFAAIGRSTAQTLLTYGYTPSFVGTQNTIESTAKEFGEILNNASVLFPQSAKSLGTIQKYLKPNAIIHNLVVYETQLVAQNFESEFFDIAVFTSPSQVKGFFLENKSKSIQNTKCIAIGIATANELTKSSVQNVFIARKPNEIALLEKVVEQSIDPIKYNQELNLLNSKFNETTSDEKI